MLSPQARAALAVHEGALTSLAECVSRERKRRNDPMRIAVTMANSKFARAFSCFDEAASSACSAVDHGRVSGGLLGAEPHIDGLRSGQGAGSIDVGTMCSPPPKGTSCATSPLSGGLDASGMQQRTTPEGIVSHGRAASSPADDWRFTAASEAMRNVYLRRIATLHEGALGGASNRHRVPITTPCATETVSGMYLA